MQYSIPMSIKNQVLQIKDSVPSIKKVMGPLHVVSHEVQKHLAGEQEVHWDKTNKENYYFR